MIKALTLAAFIILSGCVRTTSMVTVEAVNSVISALPDEHHYLLAKPGDDMKTLRWKLVEANKQLSLLEAKIISARIAGKDIIKRLED